MMKLAVPVLLALGILGCGGSSNPGPGGATYPLPGATQIDIPAGSCIIVNAAPQSLPPSTVFYSLTDGGAYPGTYEVGVVPSSDTCQFSQADSFIDDGFTGSASDTGTVLAGVYDLDIICQNASADCFVDSVTWSATY
ncbi:MAG TPA: hypothetical protein VLA79_13285 [Polyangia bacterium]|nr:hypothetical protein [Polyangia bacterium]